MRGTGFGLDTTTETKDRQIDRRDLLTRAAALVAGVFAATVVPGVADASTGDTVHVGQPADVSPAVTDAGGTDPGPPAIWGRNLNQGSVIYEGGYTHSYGVYGESAMNDGVRGHSSSDVNAGVRGHNDASASGGPGVHGSSVTGNGVYGEGHDSAGVFGTGPTGVYGSGPTGVSGYGYDTGVEGTSQTGDGVSGTSDAGDGVSGNANAANKSGVFGINPNAGYGVFGNGGLAGVSGVSGTGDGVHGEADSGVGVSGVSDTGDGLAGTAGVANKSGVHGVNLDPNGYGVFGRGGAAGVAGLGTAAGPGLWGRSATGPGVLADGQSDSGVGLVVKGKMRVTSRSGVATVAKGKTTCIVKVPGGTTLSSVFLVTMQGNPGAGVYVQCAARYTQSTFRLVLSKAAANATAFAWLVLD